MAKVSYKGIGDAQEPVNLDDGPHLLRCIKAVYGPGKQDPTKFRCEVILDCPQEPDKNGVFHYISDPNPEGTEKGEAFKFLQTKRFMVAFGVDFDNEGYDPDDILGKEAEIVTKTEKDEKTGMTSTKLVLPELPV